MAKHVSLTTLLDWNKCQRRHYLAHTRHLRPIERAPALGSGSAVDGALQYWLSNFPGEPPAPTQASEIAARFLAREYNDDEAKYGRYVKGAVNALSLVPDWVWERKWECQTPVTIPVGEWEVHGRTDIWGVSDDGVTLIDFKVSEANPLDLMLWSPQIRYYALALQAMHPDRAVQYKYLLLPTQGKRAGDPSTWPFTRAQAARTLADLAKLVSDFASHQTASLTGSGWWYHARPAYDRSACGYCPFNPICQAEITGADRLEVERTMFFEHQRGVTGGDDG